jgi:predicted nucleic-acid-binding protein
VRAVDTNVLLRYFVGDDLSQQAVSDRFFEECRLNRETVFVPVPVLCEFFWVAERGYKQSKLEIIAVLRSLVEMELIRVDCEAAVRAALTRYEDGRGGYADYLIGELSAQAGCRDTVSFDRALRGEPGFTILRA